MQYIRTKRKFYLRLSILFYILLFAACSGGGSKNNDAQTPLVYTGSTDKVLIDESNAAEVTTGAVNDGIRGNALGGVIALDASFGFDETRTFSPFYLAERMEATIAFFGEDLLSPKGSSIMVVRTSQEDIEGSCGGQAGGQFSIDDATGEFWGELTFADYCESSVTLNGKMTFTGTIDLSTNQFLSLSFDFNKLKGNDLSNAFVIDGTMYLVQEDFETGITMNLFIEDSQHNDVFWLNDYHLAVTNDFSTLTLNISGKYYHPDHGYVTLSTQEDLTFSVDRMIPISGVLVAIGKNGTAGGPTMARLSCSPDGMFRAEADTDGDGVYDWDSGEKSWDAY